MAVISFGGSRAFIMEKGAYLSTLVLDGKDILKPSADGSPTHGGAALLSPYAGRVRKGKYIFAGREHHLPIDNGPHSIHGFMKDRTFSVTHRGSTAVFSCTATGEGYPWQLETEISFTISNRSISVNMAIKGDGEAGLPLVAGFHPYFLTGGKWAIKHSEPMNILEFTDRYFPDGTMKDYSFNGLDTAGKSYDNCFAGGGDITISGERNDFILKRKNMPYLVVYNGKYTGGGSVAVEPMTGAPDAFNNGIGLVTIRAGETFQCGYSIEIMERS